MPVHVRLGLLLIATCGWPAQEAQDDRPAVPSISEAREDLWTFETSLFDADEATRTRRLREHFSALRHSPEKLASLEMITSRYVVFVPPGVVNDIAGPLLDDPDAQVRVAAVHALRFGEHNWKGPNPSFAARVIEIFAEFESAGDAENAEAVLRHMGMLGADEYLAPIKRHLDASSPDVREAAVAALSHWLRIQSRSLTKLASDPEASVRAATMRAMGMVSPNIHVEELARGFHDSEVTVRDAVVSAWQSWGHPSGQSHLSLALRDPDGSVRGHAAYALSQLRTPDYAPEVARLLE